MADGHVTPPVIAPGAREGRSVSILTDRRAILEAFRRGWIDDVEIAREIRDECRADLEAYAAVNPPPDELLDRRLALAKVATSTANMTAKAVATAEGQTQPTGDTFNTQINILGEQPVPKALQTEHGRDALSRLRDAIADGNAPVAGDA